MIYNYDETATRLDKLELAVRKTIPLLWEGLCHKLKIGVKDDGSHLLLVHRALLASMSDVAFTTYVNSGISEDEAADLADELVERINPILQDAVLPLWGKEKTNIFFTDEELN